MSRHLERLLQIDNLLRSYPHQTSVSLAKALEVSERTIRSDLSFLRDRPWCAFGLPEKSWIDLQQLADERIVFRSGAQMVNLDPDTWQQLLEACRRSRRVWIHYYAASRLEESERVVDPYLQMAF